MTRATDRALSTAEMHAFGEELDAIRDRVIGSLGASDTRYIRRVAAAVRCAPPENKPTPEEVRTCRPFLAGPLAALPGVRVFVALGQIAHDTAVRTLGGKASACKFGHLAEHRLPDGRILSDSYHCSRYNQNTGRLTPEMFEAVFARAVALRDA